MENKYKKKTWIAMLLAGGQGSRLFSLTDNIAKPAVSFGGKYKIIDFSLSNCINSGIDTVGVLTQYQPFTLNEYIGKGEPWDLDREFGGVTVLPPYQAKEKSDFYRGTANAVYQNLRFIERYSPDNVIILSGDHVYKMDYSRMLEYHKKSRSACTIAVINVPIYDAGRFGIVSSDNTGRIKDFEEKPEHPKSTTASMGIYIFETNKLISYLEKDDSDPKSSKDFGKNIIPIMLKAGEPMYAYSFSGYWRDVGTIKSLYDSNMDLLGDSPVFNLHDRNFRIFSRNSALPPQYIGDDASVSDSIITEGCEIHGTVENSVISGNVYIAKNAFVRGSVIMNGVYVGENASVIRSIVDENVKIGVGAKVGKNQDGTIKNGANMSENTEITVVKSRTALSPGENYS